MRRIPSQPVLVGELVVGVDQEVDILRQRILLGQELLGVLIERRRRPRVYEQNPRSIIRELAGILDEVMHLPHTIRALVAWIPAQNDKDDWSFPCKFGQAQMLPIGCRQGELRRWLPDIRRLRMSEANAKKQPKSERGAK